MSLLLVLAALFFVYRWAGDLSRPGMAGSGWRGFIDQNGYYKEAQFLANLKPIPESEFGFGPGYPLLAAPFVRLGSEGWPEGDPFFVANLGVWLLTIAATYKLGTRLMGQWPAIAATVFLAFGTPLVDTLTLPWSTTVSLGAVMVVGLVALRTRLSFLTGLALGLAMGLTFAARYLDVIWIAICVTAVLFAKRGLTFRHSSLYGVAVGAGLVVLPTLWLHHQAFGTPFSTPYAHGNPANLESFRLANVIPHALQSFVSPYYFGDKSQLTPLLAKMFPIVIAPIGACLAFFDAAARRRVLIASVSIASLLSTIAYWAFWFTGTYGLQFGSIHFFKMWWPLWVLAATYVFHRLTLRPAPA